MRYLYKKDFTDLEGYGVHRCHRIINEYTKVHIWYHRGQYKGYTYIIKLMRVYSPRSYQQQVPFYKVYNIIKQARLDANSKFHPEVDYIRGIKYSLYDCMNYLNAMD